MERGNSKENNNKNKPLIKQEKLILDSQNNAQNKKNSNDNEENAIKNNIVTSKEIDSMLKECSNLDNKSNVLFEENLKDIENDEENKLAERITIKGAISLSNSNKEAEKQIKVENKENKKQEDKLKEDKKNEEIKEDKKGEGKKEEKNENEEGTENRK